MVIDVIIPTYKPDNGLFKLIDKLKSQTKQPSRIVLMNTEQKYIENLMRGRKSIKGVEIYNISAWEFDHGNTRNAGANGSVADILIYMTQDAIPEGDDMIEELIRPLMEGKAEVSYARQVPRDDASLAERFSREFNYPGTSCVKSAADIERLGIKAFFCSNVCAAYRRDVFDMLGRFPANMIFNEDMVFAHKVLMNGYRIAYSANARVVHSHNYSNMQQFHRNYDIAVSQKMHPEVFEGISSESEGKSYAKAAYSYFREHGRPQAFVPFAITCAYRLLGFKLGKKYDRMPRKMVLSCTMSPRYFKRMWS